MYLKTSVVASVWLSSLVCFLAVFVQPSHANEEELNIALSIADTLRAARTVIANNQALINDAEVGDKGLSGEKVVTRTISHLREKGNTASLDVDPQSKHGQLVNALLASIAEVIDTNQKTINRKGVGFKGFVPAVFARLVNERFSEKVGTDAKVKVTAPIDLVRNRKARPDRWERSVIEEKFKSSQWSRGALYSELTESEARPAFRVMVPEYYSKACLACHGSPKDEIDVTGYPKEGRQEGDLGGAISVTLFQ